MKLDDVKAYLTFFGSFRPMQGYLKELQSPKAKWLLQVLSKLHHSNLQEDMWRLF